jgi:hypothetical protein
MKPNIEQINAALLNLNSPELFKDKILSLKVRIQKLSNICQELNPYEEIPLPLKERLAEFQIYELSDPFKVTNTLLLLLEDTIDELHILEPLSDSIKLDEIL